ncbi:MAG: anti-sigma F factor [Clostridia bacterium]|nr:anti-sigma F factor [Clostridia bacterium]
MNKMKITFDAVSENESFARLAVSGFLLYKNPNMGDIEDIKMAVSEAVTNSIIHGYDGEGVIDLSCSIEGRRVCLVIEDYGKGIENIEKAREPMYTSKPECERSGLGFTVMESFMDGLEISSQLGKGTRITMYKDLA